jgi:Fic family protein
VGYRPPFEITSHVLATLGEITRLVGRYEGLQSPTPQPRLRRDNRIRTIVGSLAIEGNGLTPDQVTAILDKRRVIGPKREIVEVENAIAAYVRAPELDPTKVKDLLAAHGLLMKELVADAGRLRAGGVGVVHGSRVLHVAPPAKQVPRLVSELLQYLRDSREHPLVLSAVAHYEIEFIHPFSDGNGRTGRLWQHVILVRWQPLFEWLPVESVVRARQGEYYRVLAACDRAASCTAFIEFSLDVILEALGELLAELKPAPSSVTTRLDLAHRHFGRREFTRKDYLLLIKTLSTATASRDLQHGVAEGLLTRTGDRSRARYRF